MVEAPRITAALLVRATLLPLVTSKVPMLLTALVVSVMPFPDPAMKLAIPGTTTPVASWVMAAPPPAPPLFVVWIVRFWPTDTLDRLTALEKVVMLTAFDPLLLMDTAPVAPPKILLLVSVMALAPAVRLVVAPAD